MTSETHRAGPAGGSAITLQKQYAYDAANNPHGVLPNTPATPGQNWTYVGNRPVTAPATPNGLPGASNLSYDAAGHLLTIDHRTLTYNAWGQLETVTENDPQQGYPLWRVRYTYDALGRRIRRDYDELGYLSTQDPTGPISTLKSDSRWYDFDGDTLIGEERIDRQYMNRPLASVPLSTEGEQRTRLLAQSFEHAPFAARSDLADLSALADFSGLSDASDYAPSRVRGPFANPFAVVANAGSTSSTSVLSGVGGVSGVDALGDALLRYGSLALVQQGSGGNSYASYTGSDLVEINGGGNLARFGPSGEITQLYDYNGRLVWDEVTADRRIDAWNNENNAGAGVPPPSFPFTTAGGYRDPATGYASNPNGGMNGAYDPAIGEDAEDGDSPAAFYRNGMREGRDQLLASPPFQPGSDARRLYSEYVKHIPFAGQAYSGYTAITGYDPVSGECLSAWDRLGDGLSAVPTIPHGGGKRGTGRPQQMLLGFDDLPEPIERTNLHHPFPKYLGGAKNQPLVEIPVTYHKALHRELDKTFRRSLGKFYYDVQRLRDPVGFRARVWRALSNVYDQYPLTDHPTTGQPFNWTGQGMR